MATAEAQRESVSGAGSVSEERLLDVLYEILAQGVDPTQELSLSEVERFLHEHARRKKPLTELVAFFARHGLSEDPADYGGDPELGELASGLHRERSPDSAMFALDAPEHEEGPLAETPTGRATVSAGAHTPALSRGEREENETSGLKLRMDAPVPPARNLVRRWAVYAALALMLGGLLFGLKHNADMERELAQARLQQHTTDAALSALEQRAEGMRAALGESEHAHQDLSQKFESFVSDEAKKRAADEAALKRILGSKYDALRERALESQDAPAVAHP